MRLKSAHTWLLLLAVAAMASAALLATPAAAQQKISWKHSDCTDKMDPANVKCTPLIPVTAEPGETISLTITNTCPDDFTYTTVPLPLMGEDAGLQAAVVEKKCKDSKVVDVRHDPQYGGYLINVVRKEGSNTDVGNARITLAVRTSEWKIGFAGGFTANGLIDPPYALKPLTVTTGTTTTTRYQLTEQDDRKDDVGRSVVSFVHVSHSKLPKFGLSFGLGVEPDRGGDYYAGPSFLFGDRAALTAGYAIGEVKSPPSGRSVKDTLDDANALNNLGQRRKGTWFVGLSYRFLGGGAEDLKKPFLGQAAPAAAGEGVTQTANDANKNDARTVDIVAGDKQSVKAGTTSQPLKIKAAWAPKTSALWSVKLADPAPFTLVPGVVTSTDAQGEASVTVQIAPGTAAGDVPIRARICDAKDPGKCGEVTFTLTVAQ